MSFQIYGHLCIWKFPLNSKLLGDKDCLHWIWPVKKKWLLFLLPFHCYVPCIFISYCCLCQCQAVCYYYMPVPTKYHWNISFQKKFSLKNARNVTQFVWLTFFYWISRVCQKKIKYMHQNLKYYETRANSFYGSKKIESYVWKKYCNIWSSLIPPPPFS